MTKQLEITNGVYLPSIESCDIWEHMNREKELYSDYTGFLPYSLELRKLNEQKEFKTFTTNRQPNKVLTRDLINVKFDNVVQSGFRKKELIDKKIKDKETEIEEFKLTLCSLENAEIKDESSIEEVKGKIEQTEEYIKGLKESKKLIPDEWVGKTKKELRHELYENGFTITRVNRKTGEIFKDSYKMYKRSSSKSRKGQCLFIKDSLCEIMTKWSRMNLDFVNGDSVDLASLSAYSSLVTSSIERVLKIDPKSILVVDEVISKWKEPDAVNVVKLVKGNVESVQTDNHTIENNIFDGEILLDSNFFEENQSMMLLRHHWTKGAAFSTNLQTWFEDYCIEKGWDYETRTVRSIFDEELLLKDIKMVINPTCIKFLKMSYLFAEEGENEKDHGPLWQQRIWEHWKGLVEAEGNFWGVCKHDKTNRRGELDGLPLQRLSYQMINSLEADFNEVSELAQSEVNYIEGIKNNPEKFIEHVKLKLDEPIEDEDECGNKPDLFSSSKMFIDLYEQNKDIIHNPAFKKFKTDTIYDYVKDVKKGRIRLVGDYATLFSSPLNYLYHAVGETITEPIGLVGNEVYTTLFGEEGFGEELTIFRNPHTSASNIWVGMCKQVPEIEKYFNLTPNVICVQSCKENLMERLSGCDFDSDATAVFFDEQLLRLSKKVYGKYKVCVNGLDADKTPYTLSLKSMAELDHTLARATTEIGSIVNEGQLCNALYFDYLHNGKVRQDIYEQTDILTVLSMCSIDSAKRKYKINIGSELRKIQKFISAIVKTNYEGSKPNFFRYIDKKEGVTFKHYNTPMDHLYEVLSKIEDANGVKTWNFKYFLSKVDIDKANRKQRERVRELVAELVNKLESIHSKKYKKKEKNVKLADTTAEYLGKIGKLKIKQNTMYSILKDIDEKKYKSIRTKLLNCLYQAHTETFLNCFKKSHG
jgi:hypothetical protein